MIIVSQQNSVRWSEQQQQHNIKAFSSCFSHFHVFMLNVEIEQNSNFLLNAMLMILEIIIILSMVHFSKGKLVKSVCTRKITSADISMQIEMK